MRRMSKFYALLLVALVILFVDQVSKTWVMRHFSLGQSRVIAPFFYLTYVHNTGTAFGLFQGNNFALLILAFVILGTLLYAARGLSERGGLFAFWGIALVMGGALGNIIDRWRFGHVVDFLDFRVWPVFNVADSAICVGAFFMALGLFRAEAER